MSHIDEELLSAFLDGETTEQETREVEAHVSSCDPCQVSLESLRFAVAGLRALDEPEMPELHRKQLWREINRARRAPANRWRALVAVAGTAAAIVAFAGVTMIGQGQDADVAAGDADFRVTEQQWTSSDLDGLMAAPMASEMAPADQKSPTVASSPSLPMSGHALEPDTGTGRGTREENHGARIARCEEEIVPGGDAGAVAVEYIVAHFEGTPAYILVYDVPKNEPTQREVYVLDRTDCRILEHRVSS